MNTGAGTNGIVVPEGSPVKNIITVYSVFQLHYEKRTLLELL